ncbi:hypothetical protein WR25_05881, partial [Diploscapter pachys]
MSTVYSKSQPTKEHVTILAIPDSSSNDQSQQVSMSQSTSAEICSIIKLPDSNDNNETSFGTGNRISKLISSFENPSNKSDVVEIFDSSKIYSVGSLRVSNTGGKQKKGQDESKVDKPSVSEPVEESQAQPPLRSSLRNYNPKPQTSHHDSPKILKFEDEENGEQPTRQRFIRNSQRKSKITDAYFDALEDYEDSNSSPMGRGYSPGILRHSSRFTSPASIEPTSTLLVFPDDEQTPMGIEVTGIQDELGKLTAIQIIKIQEDGRVAKDGRLRVGDNILEIDGRPVYQMSMIRARAYLSEFTNKEAPSLSIERNSAGDDSYDWKRNDSATNIQTKPILSLLQQANTQQIGKTQMIELEKSPNGFGFTVTGRDTASGERLFYIGTVKPHGVALGHLQGGDRLLEINGESTAKLSQADIVERLKNAAVGETVKFLISRVAQNKSTKEEDEKSPVERENEDPLEPKSVAKSLSATISERAESSHSHSSEFEDILLTVPLNDTGSAGLGVSLKARVSVKHDGSRYDCGIFIKNVMHGGAAHKDGRLRVNDRIVGIEDIDFTEMTNSAASEAITKKLKAIGPNATHVRLKIRRSRKEDASFNMETVSQASNRNSRRESEIMAKSLDESELINSMNAFDREAPYRKSLSERRGMGASTDPNHIKLFQEIKHQRQTSAPSRSVEHEGRARSASVHPKGSDTPQHIRYSSQSRADARIRRSLSYDREPNISSVEFGDNERAVLGATSPLHPFPPGTPIVIEYRNGNGQITGGTQRAQNRERSVEKGRRKSVGSAMKSFFGIGSKSRDASPEKSLKDTSSISKEEERRRVVEHYDRLRRNEENGTSPQMQRAAKDSISRSQSDYRNSAQVSRYRDGPFSGAAYDEWNDGAWDAALRSRYRAHQYEQQGRGQSAAPAASGFIDAQHGVRRPSLRDAEGDEIPIYRRATTRNGNSIGRSGPFPDHSRDPASAVHAHPQPHVLYGAPSTSSASNSKSHPNLAGFDGEYYSAISPPLQPGGMPRPDYCHMFNSWFAYSGTGRPGGYQHPAHFK